MAQLAGERVRAAHEPVADDDATADARRDRDVDIVGNAARGTELTLRERRDLRVPLENGLDAECLAERVGEREAPQLTIEVGRVDQDAFVGIERPGRRDAERNWPLHPRACGVVERGAEG